jgi:hypothetical protein
MLRLGVPCDFEADLGNPERASQELRTPQLAFLDPQHLQ